MFRHCDTVTPSQFLRLWAIFCKIIWIAGQSIVPYFNTNAWGGEWLIGTILKEAFLLPSCTKENASSKIMHACVRVGTIFKLSSLTPFLHFIEVFQMMKQLDRPCKWIKTQSKCHWTLYHASSVAAMAAKQANFLQPLYVHTAVLQSFSRFWKRFYCKPWRMLTQKTHKSTVNPLQWNGLTTVNTSNVICTMIDNILCIHYVKFRLCFNSILRLWLTTSSVSF